MPSNPYTAPSADAAASPGTPPAAPLAGRILAPLIVPLLVGPPVLGVISTVAWGMPVSALGGAIANYVPLALVSGLFVSPIVMLALLPWRRLGWLKRGLLAALIQLVLLALIMAALFRFIDWGPGGVELPPHPASRR